MKQQTITPVISIIMPVYNAEKYIAQAIQSVIIQSYRAWELIIVDDCSTDNTYNQVQQIIKNIPNGYIRIMHNEYNCGPALSRNNGIQMARGSYIAFIDSDDVWNKDKLKRQMEQIESVKNREKECSGFLCYTAYDFIDEYGNPVLKPYHVPSATNYREMLIENVIGCSSVVVSKSLLDKVKGPFDKNFYHEDYALWMELLQVGGVAIGIDDILMSHRQLSTGRSISKRKAALERWKIYRKKLRMNLFSTLVAFAQYSLNGVRKYK